MAWKIPVEGRAWSSPVVLDRQIWLTTAVETPGSPADLQQALARVSVSVPSPYVARRVILKALCLDRETGRQVHEVTLFEVVAAVGDRASGGPRKLADPAWGSADPDSRRLRSAVRDGFGQADGGDGLADRAAADAHVGAGLPQGFQHAAGDRARGSGADGGARCAVDGFLRSGDGPRVVAGGYGADVLERRATGLRLRSGWSLPPGAVILDLCLDLLDFPQQEGT